MYQSRDLWTTRSVTAVSILFVVVAVVSCAPTVEVDRTAPGNARAEHSSACSAAEELVSVPDAALAEALRRTLRPGEAATSSFSCEELAQVVSLRAAGVSSLEGLELAINLNRLNLDGSQLTDLEPLAGLTRLASLSAVGSSLTSLDVVATLPSLAVLDIADNQVTDLAPLAAVTRLAFLNAARNAITDISPLEGLPNLYWLDLSDNDVSDISMLANNSALDVLVLDDNDVSDADALSDLVGLRRVGLARNSLTDVDFMERLDLEMLDVSSNRIESVAGLARNRSLGTGEGFDLRDNCIDVSSDNPFVSDLLERGSGLLLEPQDASCVAG